MSINEKSLQLNLISDLKNQNWIELTPKEFVLERNEIHEIILKNIFIKSIKKINPQFQNDWILLIEKKIHQILDNDATLLAKNREFLYLLKFGMWISPADHEPMKINLIDLENFSKNNFNLVQEFKVTQDKKTRRADIVLFINGLPVIIMELKSPNNDKTNWEDAAKQIENYFHAIPNLFVFNIFNVATDGVEFFYSALNATKIKWLPWRRKSFDDRGEFEKAKNPSIVQNIFIEGLLNQETLCNFVKYFIFFRKNDCKIIPRYHQYYAALKAYKSIKDNNFKKIGIIWHTQGSGKSITMLFLTHIIYRYTQNTVIFITDRNNLDNQLFTKFKDLDPDYLDIPDNQHIKNSKELKNELKKVRNSGIYFSTIQKFNSDTGILSNRKNIVIIVDEAHRSQYGMNVKMVVNQNTKKTQKNYGYAKYLHNAFPDAKILGFTATPIEKKDKSTEQIFGKILDTYNMQQSIEDGITVPLTYQRIVIPLKLKNQDNKTSLTALIKQKQEAIPSTEFEKWENKKSKQIVSSLLYSDSDRINKLVECFCKHYEKRRKQLYGKALFVAYDRKSAYKIYQALSNLPELKDKVVLIVTRSNQDSNQNMVKAIGEKSDRSKKIEEFKKLSSPIKIAVVVDMLLTGFDMPALDVMYIDKEMHSHTLFQALARVNRAFTNKEKGLIVSFIDLKKSIDDAIDYYVRNTNSPFILDDVEKLLLNISSWIANLESFFPLDYLQKLLRAQIKFLPSKITSNDWEVIFQNLNRGQQYEIIKSAYDRLCDLDKQKKQNSAQSVLNGLFLPNVNKLIKEYRYMIYEIDKMPLIKEKIMFFMALKNIHEKVANVSISRSRIIEEDWEEQVQKAIILQEENITHQESKVINLLDKESWKKEVASIKEQFSKQEHVYGKAIITLVRHKLQDSSSYLPRTSFKLIEKLNALIVKYNTETIDSQKSILTSIIELPNVIAEKNALIKNDLKLQEAPFYDILRNDDQIQLDQNTHQNLINICHEISDLKIQMEKIVDWDKHFQFKNKFQYEVGEILYKYNYHVYENNWLKKRTEIFKNIQKFSKDFTI